MGEKKGELERWIETERHGRKTIGERDGTTTNSTTFGCRVLALLVPPPADSICHEPWTILHPGFWCFLVGLKTRHPSHHDIEQKTRSIKKLLEDAPGLGSHHTNSVCRVLQNTRRQGTPHKSRVHMLRPILCAFCWPQWQGSLLVELHTTFHQVQPLKPVSINWQKGEELSSEDVLVEAAKQ